MLPLRQLVLVGSAALLSGAGVAQAQSCTSVNLASSGKTSPAAGETIHLTVIGTPAFCGYTATSNVPWITVQAGDPLRLVVAGNGTASRRTGRVTIVNRTFTVSQLAQQPAISCTLAATPLTIRTEGKAELTGDLTGTCTGTPPAGATADFSLILDTDVASRMVTAPDITEATLILNNATPVVGATAFRGALTSTRSLRFSRVPLTGLQSFGIVNVRANPNSSFSGSVAGRLEVRSSTLVGMPTDPVTLANTDSGLLFTFDAPAPGPALNTVQYNAKLSEHFPNAFKTQTPAAEQATEAGFTHAGLGAVAGTADAGTRFLLRISGFPAGRTLYAPVSLNGGAARLVSADEFGAGGSLVTGQALFGGTYGACSVTGDGTAHCTWEVFSAPAATLDTLVARMVVAGLNVSTNEVQDLIFSTNVHFGPTSEATPWFQGPSPPQQVLSVDLATTPLGDPTRVGSNYAFSYRVSNDGLDSASDVTIRGNAPPGFQYSGCTRSDGGACQISGNGVEATATLTSLNSSASVDITFTATPAAALSDGTWTENVIWANSVSGDINPGNDVTSSGVVVEACAGPLSPASGNATSQGGAQSVSVPAVCSNWTALSLVNWITVTSGASGNGAGTVQYNVQANLAAQPRTGRLLIAGIEFPVTQAPVCVYSSNPAGITLSATGGNGAFQLTTTHPSCAWTASSNQTWLTVTPQSGTGTTNFTATAAAYTGATVRTGVVTVGGATYTVTQQPPPPCTFTVNPASANVGSAAGSGTFVLNASSASCAWTASSNQSWLTLPVTSGSGSRSAFQFHYAQNAGTARSATVTAGGQQFTVNQAAAPVGCAITTTPLTYSVPHAGQTITQNLTAPACAWTAASNRSWAQVYPASGTGSGSFTITAFPHFGTAARTAAVSVGASTITITQAGNPESEAARFIRLLYFSFLGRVPSAAEIQAQINGGLGRADLAHAFLNSLEFNQGGRFVAGLYVGLLNRNAEFTGWQFQRDALGRNVVTQDSLVSNFLSSLEYKLRFGTLTDPEYIRQLYGQILLRTPSQSEVDFHVSTLPALGRIQVARNFLNTEEFRIGTGPRLTAFLLYATLLLRDASTAELNAMLAQLGQNPVRTLVQGVVTSPEFALLLQ